MADWLADEVTASPEGYQASGVEVFLQLLEDEAAEEVGMVAEYVVTGETRE